MAKKILFVINVDWFFISHRLPLALAALKNGYEVHIACGLTDKKEYLESYGLHVHPLNITRSGMGIKAELKTIGEIFKVLRLVKPDLAHFVTIKPVLYGGLMARITGVPAVVVAISGLGTVFVAQDGRGAWLRKGVETLYRLALGHRNLRAIFQNPDDRAVLVGLGAVRNDQAVLVRGSGVVLVDYPVLPEPEDVPVVSFAARLLKDKGVSEFVQASRILRERGVSARFWLIGSSDPHNPTSVSEHEVAQWGEKGVIEPFGYRDDIGMLFSQSNIVVLPSYYGEGLPKVLIEAAACGRAVVTTNHPGCRDAIEPGKTGVLVAVRDAVALADAIQTLIEDPVRRQKMGAAGRVLAEREFSIEKVVETHLKVYQELLLAEAT